MERVENLPSDENAEVPAAKKPETLEDVVATVRSPLRDVSNLSLADASMMEPVENLPSDENAGVPAAKKPETLEDVVATVRSPLRDVSNLSLADASMMEPVEILPIDENAAVPAAKKPETLEDVVATVRSPLKDVSNLSLADASMNGSNNSAERTTIVAVDDSVIFGSKCETESPAPSTPSRHDTSTDDFESADEGSPVREVNLSTLATKLETLSLGTPKQISARPGILFPYSPVNDTSILLSSPEKDDSEILDSTISPITSDGDKPAENVGEPEVYEGFPTGVNRSPESAFKIPDAIVKRERPSIASSVTTGRSDDTFYTANSTIWSPYPDLNHTIVKSPEVDLGQSSFKYSADEKHDSTAENSSNSNESALASSLIQCKLDNSYQESLANVNPKDEDSSKEEGVKSPLNEFIAKTDKITLRGNSPLATSLKEKCDGEDLNSSLAPASLGIEGVISKRHSTEFCKKDILNEATDDAFRRHSFHEDPEEFSFVLDSPDKEQGDKRKSLTFFLSFGKENFPTRSNPNESSSEPNCNCTEGAEVASSEIIPSGDVCMSTEKTDSYLPHDKSSDILSELEIAKGVIDSCIATATNAVSPQQNDIEVVNSVEIKESRDIIVTSIEKFTSPKDETIIIQEAGTTSQLPKPEVEVVSPIDPIVDNTGCTKEEISLTILEDTSKPTEMTELSTPSPKSSDYSSELEITKESVHSTAITNYGSSQLDNVEVVNSEDNKERNFVENTSEKLKSSLGDELVIKLAENIDGSTSLLPNSFVQVLPSSEPSSDGVESTKEEINVITPNATSGIMESSSLNVSKSSELSFKVVATDVVGPCIDPDTNGSFLQQNDVKVLNSEEIHGTVETNIKYLTPSPDEKVAIHRAEDVTAPTSQLSDLDVKVIPRSESTGDASGSATKDSEIIPDETAIPTEGARSMVQCTLNAPVEDIKPSESLPSSVDIEPLSIVSSMENAGMADVTKLSEKKESSYLPLGSSEILSERKIAKEVIDKCVAPTNDGSPQEADDKVEAPVEAIKPSESLPPLSVDIEPLSNINSIDIAVMADDTKLTEKKEAPTNDGSPQEADVKVVSSEGMKDTEETSVEKSESTPSEKLVIQLAENDAGHTSLLPNSDVRIVSSTAEPTSQADNIKEKISGLIPNGTEILNKEAESSCLPMVQNNLNAPIVATELTEKLPMPVGSGAHSNTSVENTVIASVALPNQTSDTTESVVSSSIAIKNKLSSSDTLSIKEKAGDGTQHSSQSPVDTFIPNAPSSKEVDFTTGLSTLGESFIVARKDQGSPRTETHPEETKKLAKKVDFSNLAGTQEGLRPELDIKSVAMDFYSSPESTHDQNTSNDKEDRCYNDLSQILATCSKQEQELGGRTFDFSCIQAEAAKIASDISAADELKSSELSNKQLMMQSSISAETNNSEAGPVTADEDFNKEEFYQKATTFDFEFLEKAGDKHVRPSSLARQSLFVKFDPLVAGILASSEFTTMADNNQSSGEEGKLDISPPSHSESDERLIPITPAAAKKGSRQPTGSHTPSLRQEISKLQELMIQQEQAHQEKADLVEELRTRIAELEASENHRDTSDLEKKLKQKDEALKQKEEELEKALASNKQLVQVMEEYEKTISQLVTVKEEVKAQMEKDKETIAAERDTALQHLTNMEIAFNDIHQKYERTKSVVETLHANEKELKKSYDAAVERVEAQNIAYQKLKQHAAEKLTAANAEIEKIHKEYNGEMARMKAVAKKNELKCKSLEESLEQKKNELREMTQICDELIGKVTSKPYE